MLDFIKENVANIIVIGIIVILIVIAIIKIIKDRKRGIHSCGGDCSCCQNQCKEHE